MRVTDWTIGLYWFLVLYAVVLFLLQAVLIPRTWDGVGSLQTYFLERRVWFYSMLGFATALDQVDSYLKGGFEYILNTGYVNMAFAASTVPVVITGILSTNIKIHNIMATAFLSLQVLIGFGFLEMLAM